MTLYDNDRQHDANGAHIALEVGTMNSSGVNSEIRRKAVWGRSVLALALVALFATSIPALAQGKSKAAKPHHPKLDSVLNQVADTAGDVDVIVMFNDDSDASTRIKNNGGSTGRKLGIIRGRTTRISKMLLKRLAD